MDLWKYWIGLGTIVVAAMLAMYTPKPPAKAKRSKEYDDKWNELKAKKDTIDYTPVALPASTDNVRGINMRNNTGMDITELCNEPEVIEMFHAHWEDTVPDVTKARPLFH